MSLVFDSSVWLVEPRFQGHEHLHWRCLRDKEVEGILDVETHGLETRGQHFKAIGRPSSYPRVVRIWPS